MWIETYDKGKKQDVKTGQVINGTYYKKVPKTNILKLNDSVDIQRSVLDCLDDMGIENIRIKIEGRGIFNSKLSDWLQPGIWQKDWGNGEQRFLPIKDMTKDGKEKIQQESI